jgi:hypothetical protein
MKKLMLLSAILIGAIYSASAQYYSHNSDMNSSAKFGIGVSSGFATGPVSGSFPEAGALSFKLELPIGKSPVSFLLSTGYTFYVSEGGYELDFGGYGYGGSTYYSGDIASFIPIEAGLKAYIANRVFIEGEAGVSFNINGYSSDYTYKPTDFIYSPSIGYTFRSGYRSSIDLSLMYENRPETGGGYEQVAVRAVLNFGLSGRR